MAIDNETTLRLLVSIIQADDPTVAIAEARAYIDRQLTNTVYCEFCGAPKTGIRDPERFVKWMHGGRRSDVVRCDRHERTSKYDRRCRTFNPLTGEPRKAQH